MLIVSPFVVVHDFNFPCCTVAPLEAEPPLIVNADAMLAASATVQGFQAIAWRDAKIINFLCRIDGKKFGSRTALDLVRNVSNRVAREKRNRTFVGEALDHGNTAYRITVRKSM
jgi:hypothetical protein